MGDIARRAFMQGAGIGALAFSVGGVEVMLTAAQARAQGVPLRMLTPAEAQTLEAVGETLAIGARQAGIAHFVDQQLGLPPPFALLTIRVSEIRPPYINFYRAALEKVDAVIVGAGAAGAVFAAVLARAGKKVVVMEQGPDWQLSDLISSDIWARRLRGSGAPILYEGRHPVGRTGDHGWGTGGAALHYSANFPRLLPSDFTMKSDHGRGLDWPISYGDVAPYYDRTAREIGVSGDAKAEERWRPPGEPYPMPPLKTFRHGEVWVPGFKSVGIAVAPGAVGVNSTEYQGRAACIHDGWCGAGCPTGALANPQATYLGEARVKGAEVRPMSYVTRI